MKHKKHLSPHCIDLQACALAAFLALATPVSAQDIADAAAAAHAATALEEFSGFRFQNHPENEPYVKKASRGYFGLFGGGFGFGGDELATVFVQSGFNDVDEESINAGDGAHLLVGGGFFPKPATLSIQATIGFRAGGVTAGSESVDFMYFPAELSVHYHLKRHRIGFGAILAFSPELDLKDADLGSAEYDDAAGMFIQYEFQINKASLALRFADIDFELKSLSAPGNSEIKSEPSGDYVGAYLLVPF